MNGSPPQLRTMVPVYLPLFGGTLFDPFVTAGKHNGTGLGLTLARRIAEEHGGSVRLEESDRERTVFTLSLTKSRSLPLAEPKSGRAASKPAAMNLRTPLKESTN